MFNLKTLLLIFFLFIATPTLANSFDPNYIISDAEILDSTSMSLGTIQEFLNNKGGYLSNYSCLNADGVMKSSAEIIYDAS
ncbi:MAG: hypothetical protein ABIA02_01500, partial [Candidatus Falkowbacteria bacterium]